MILKVKNNTTLFRFCVAWVRNGFLPETFRSTQLIYYCVPPGSRFNYTNVFWCDHNWGSKIGRLCLWPCPSKRDRLCLSLGYGNTFGFWSCWVKCHWIEQTVNKAMTHFIIFIATTWFKQIFYSIRCYIQTNLPMGAIRWPRATIITRVPSTFPPAGSGSEWGVSVRISKSWWLLIGSIT